jgi:alpha-ribazole phosphatase
MTTFTKTRIYLVRHGQVEGHQEKRYNGQNDVPLTDLGREQSQQLAKRLADKPLAAIYSSDLSRCVFAAEQIAALHEHLPVSEPQLRELNIGAWEGKPWQQLQAEYPIEWQARLDDIVHTPAPGGESLHDMAERIRPALKNLIEQHRGEEIALVAHGGVNRVILLDALGAPLEKLFSLEQDFGCLNVIDYYPDGISVVQLLNG